MPIFGQTVQQVVNVAEDEEAPASRLANVILQDASMTARILRVANSPYYNPRRQRVSTVSRSVVVLGFDTVRAMCLTITLVDTFVHGEPREQLIHELARAIHAAVQARTIALQRGDDSPEEVFVATLLYHLGDLAFWCFGGKHAKRLATYKKDKESALSEEEAEQEVLGFPLRRLTQGLASEWKLNELLTNVLKDPKRAGTRGRNVSLSYRLATAAEKGWNDPEVKGLMKELSALVGQPPEKTTEMVHANAKEAARIAHYYGASTAARTIPVPGQWQIEDDEAEEEPAAEDYPEADGMLQLRVLRELATFLESGKADFNLVMELVLEGMYRGIGLDRTLF
ncbi:MAG TPA: HDOD domain-containing protein, partial [Gammaproteobacteria bacterium]|nr:HDOD domain-containing protein [Gammaproteobacteria bacterium]